VVWIVNASENEIRNDDHPWLLPIRRGAESLSRRRAYEKIHDETVIWVTKVSVDVPAVATAGATVVVESVMPVLLIPITETKNEIAPAVKLVGAAMRKTRTTKTKIAIEKNDESESESDLAAEHVGINLGNEQGAVLGMVPSRAGILHDRGRDVLRSILNQRLEVPASQIFPRKFEEAVATVMTQMMRRKCVVRVPKLSGIWEKAVRNATYPANGQKILTMMRQDPRDRCCSLIPRANTMCPKCPPYQQQQLLLPSKAWVTMCRRNRLPTKANPTKRVRLG